MAPLKQPEDKFGLWWRLRIQRDWPQLANNGRSGRYQPARSIKARRLEGRLQVSDLLRKHRERLL